MPKSQSTIYDVASRAGVSISTVSRVLNNPEKVNEKTRSIVLEAINELGFVPRADARARAIKGNRRIGVITPYLTAPSFVQRLRGVSSALRQTNFELVVYTVYNKDTLNCYLETLPIKRNLDGLIILSLYFEDEYARKLINSGTEVVLVEYPHEILSSIEIDDVTGGKMAASYLVSKGYSNMGFVGDTAYPEIGYHPITLRLSGFRQGLNELKIDFNDEYILIAKYDYEITRRKAIEFLDGVQTPVGVFAATDLQAIAVINAARELGLRVPHEVGIIGFDDLDIAEYVGLTTIRQPLDESGRVAAEVLLSRLADPDRPIQHIKLPLKIIERATV